MNQQFIEWQMPSNESESLPSIQEKVVTNLADRQPNTFLIALHQILNVIWLIDQMI